MIRAAVAHRRAGWKAAGLLLAWLGVATAATAAAGVGAEPSAELPQPQEPKESQESRKPPATAFLGGFLVESRILYPLEVEGWQARGEHRFEQPELGVSVRYQHGEDQTRWIDVYFYPVGLPPPERLAREMESTLEGIRTHSGYAQVETTRVRDFAVAIGRGDARRSYPAQSVGMALRRDGKRYASAMTLLAKDLYFIKGRYSAEGDKARPARLQAQLEDFTVALVRSAHLVSTGGCWMPAPIVQVDAPDAEAAGALMSARGDAPAGAVRVVAFADRIEATDPVSVEAQALQQMAMVPAGRWIEGCHPPDEMTPRVPEGMREIRFEYRLPPENGDGTTRPLRKRRIGVG